MRSNSSHPVPGLREAKSPARKSGNGWRRGALGVLLLLLAACATPAPDIGEPGPNGTPPPIPIDGPIAYTCANGAQLMVEANGEQARVAIIGGPSMVLPRAGDGYYSNGRYGFRGGGASAQWEVGRAAPVSCSGS